MNWLDYKAPENTLLHTLTYFKVNKVRCPHCRSIMIVTEDTLHCKCGFMCFDFRENNYENCDSNRRNSIKSTT